MKIILLSNGNVHADRILEALRSRSCGVDRILLERPHRVLDYLYPGEKLSPLVMLKIILRKIRNDKRLRLARRRLNQFGTVEWIPTANSSEMVQSLQAFSPDYILLGGIRILTEEVIQVASKGVLNAHPGLLPWLRGVDVVPHAILRKVALGASVHFISPQIDTGLLLSRRLIDLSESACSLQDLEEQCNQLAAALIAEVVCKLRTDASYEGMTLGLEHRLCERLTSTEKEKLSQGIDYPGLLAVNRKFESLLKC